ncbi:MAG: esterase/lipase family protein, partial [Bdellovibrionota bacterium]
MKSGLLLAALFAFAPLLGCTSHGSAVMSPVENQLDARPAIIVIPGFYGSALKSKNTGRRVFLTAWESFFGDESLSLFQSELGTPHGPELEVEGLLGAVPAIPGLYEVQVYAPLVHRLRQLRPDAQVIPFSYDWRDDLSVAAGRLDTLIRTLQEKNCKLISLVGHSAGGLVAAYYLAYGNQPLATAQINWSGAQQVQKAVFFGTPFLGTMVSFRTLDKGSDIVSNKKLLPADAMSSFPSMYEMLPGTATLLDRAGTKLTVDLFDPELWKKNHFGLLRRSTLAASFLEDRAKFTADWLSKGRHWSDLVQLGHSTAWQPPGSLRVLNIIGTGVDTLDSGYLDPDGKLYFDPKDLKAAGLKSEP